MTNSFQKEPNDQEKEKNLLIVFVKNKVLGKVKTRLAKTIGHQAAMCIYDTLFTLTEEISKKVAVDRHIYFSDAVIPTGWEGDQKFVQKGTDLGARMQGAFQFGFEQGFKKIILIGSDLPDITEEIINIGFQKLESKEVVFGPAEDGGYYLIGMRKMHETIFKEKPWSQSNLLALTLAQLTEEQTTVGLLETLNDIDTFEDLVASNFYKNNREIQGITNTNLNTFSTKSTS